MNAKIEEAEVLFTTSADGNFEKRSMQSKGYFELPQFLSKGPAKSKSTSSASFGSERIGNFSVLFLPKNTFKFLPALMHWIQFFP